MTCLHNYLLTVGKAEYAPRGDLDGEDDLHKIIPGRWEDSEDMRNLLDVQRLAGNRSGNSEARSQREAVAEYFLTQQGQVPWQYESAFVRRV
jgi:hypothetical protein